MEYAYAEAMCLRSFVSGVSFPKSVSPEQSLNKKAPLFVQGIRLRRSHVPQKPCKWGTISKVGVPKAILEQNRAVICSRNTVYAEAMCLRSLVEGAPFQKLEYWNKIQALCVPGFL